MTQHEDQSELESARFPFYLIWVVAAIAMAGLNIAEYQATAKLSSLLIAAAWFCWSFSWYAKPFQVNFRAKASKAIVALSLRTWVPQTLWTFVTLSALALLLVGLVLKFTNSA